MKRVVCRAMTRIGLKTPGFESLFLMVSNITLNKKESVQVSKRYLFYPVLGKDPSNRPKIKAIEDDS